MTSTTRKFQTILATAVLAVSTLLIAPTAQAHTASSGGSTCTYNRTYGATTTWVDSTSCNKVRAGNQYRTHNGGTTYTRDTWKSTSSSNKAVTNLYRVQGQAGIRVPWSNSYREVYYLFK